jgi:hypothetical protein
MSAHAARLVKDFSSSGVVSTVLPVPRLPKPIVGKNRLIQDIADPERKAALQLGNRHSAA